VTDPLKHVINFLNIRDQPDSSGKSVTLGNVFSGHFKEISLPSNSPYATLWVRFLAVQIFFLLKLKIYSFWKMNDLLINNM
jgi:hypothetical protein